MRHYDYIIAGTGCAGLSLAVQLAHHKDLKKKRVLLVDKVEKKENDRTWCFWEKEPGPFEEVVCKTWQQLSVFSDDFAQTRSIAPYAYKMIRGEDFYAYCKKVLNSHPSFKWQWGEIKHLKTHQKGASLVVDDEEISADFIFSSLPQKPLLKNNHYYLLQHFKGWVIETAGDNFDPVTATLMDFRVPQADDTAFVYVLPLTKRKALVEYTIFGPKILTDEEYTNVLSEYLADKLGLTSYSILEEEFGVIPMTNFTFPKNNGAIIYIGTAGGLTKPSTGYTFQFIQQHSWQLVDALSKTGLPYIETPLAEKRFLFYDSVLLQILSKRGLPGKQIFTRLFKKNNWTQVLQFLENKSSLTTELKIISTLQKGVFLKAAFKFFSGR